MNKVFTAVVAVTLIGLAIFVGVLFSTIGGAIGGWVVGEVFSETFANYIATYQIPFQPWEIGAALGFVGGFFKTIPVIKG
jgi:hypothetical protein